MESGEGQAKADKVTPPEIYAKRMGKKKGEYIGVKSSLKEACDNCYLDNECMLLANHNRSHSILYPLNVIIIKYILNCDSMGE